MAAVVMNSDVRQHKRRPRINKHLTERRRRARINDSLTQIKNLVFPALENKLSQNSKVEKADILEMTLLYIRGLQRQNVGNQGQQQTGDHFAAGYSECLGEVSQFLLSCGNVDPDSRMQLLNHLANRCRPTSGMLSPPPSGQPSPITTPCSPASAYSPTGMQTPPDLSPRQTVEYSPVPSSDKLFIDVQGRHHDCPPQFVTPPNSPIDDVSPVSRYDLLNGQSVQSSYPEHQRSRAAPKASSVWRPWMH